MPGDQRSQEPCQSSADSDSSSKIAEFRQFVIEGRSATSAAGLENLLAGATRGLGFDYYALVEHGSLTDPLRPVITNYPSDWQHRFEEERLDLIDPVQQACRRRISGFRWSALSDIIALTPAQEKLLQASRSYGIGQGFTVPFHLPGAREASCSFAVLPGKCLPKPSLAAAQLIALAAYEKLHALGGIVRAFPIRLSPRQRACVALIAAGLTDREIGRKLGLSEETVTKYLNAARRRNGLARRAQLVTAALRDGLIGYDVLDMDSLRYIETERSHR